MKRRPGRATALGLALGAVFGLASCGGNPARLRTELLSVPGYALAAVRILVTVGSANDPPGREGLCGLTWGLLADGGSRTTSRGDLAQRLFPIGAGIGLSVDRDVSVFWGTMRAGDLDAYYSVFREALLEPGFREEDFARIKARQLAFLEKTLPEGPDDRLADEVLDLSLYAGHPYGHPAQGWIDSVNKLTLDDVKTFYRQNFVQGNIILGLGGNFSQELLAAATADFKALPRGFTPPPALPPAGSVTGIGVGIAEKETRSSSVRLGMALPVTKADKDYFPLWIAAASLEEEEGKPFERRMEGSGALAAGGRVLDASTESIVPGGSPFPVPNHCRRLPQLTVRMAASEPDGGAAGARRVLEKIRKLGEEGISEERLEAVRSRLLAEVRLYARTLDEHLAWRMDSKLAGFSDILDEAQYVLPRVGREAVREAVQKHLAGGGIRLAVVTGNAGGFAAEFGAAAVRTAPAGSFFRTEGWPER